jgi:DNA-binding MarR family transcriptional regulator
MGGKEHTTTGIGFLLADISRLLRQDFDRRVRDLGMTQAQWRALAHLAREEGMNQAALAERLEVKPISIARLIDRMEAANWVRRKADSSDRRATLIYLTPKAKPILDELETRAEQARNALMQGITASDRKRLIATLEQMKANLNANTSAAEAENSRGKENNGR